MPRHRLKVADLILIEALRFALFVIDFNGPAAKRVTTSFTSVRSEADLV
jgi:hypothetical protein